MESGSKSPPLRLDSLPTYLDDKLEHESQVLDLLIVAQARGQANPELWDKLHSAALRDDRLTELAFAYERLGQDRRVRIMPPAHQAQIFLNAARFFVRALGDIDGAQTALERVLALVPTHAEAFEQLRRILEDKGEIDKLVGMHLAAVGPRTDKDVALEHLKKALELASPLDPERASKIGQQILRLDPSDQDALVAICASLEASGKFGELARALEHALSSEPPLPAEKRMGMRVRLLELYDDKIPEIERAAPHVEEVLAEDKDNPIARRVASRLLQNRSVAPRVAAALEKVYEAEGDRGGVAQMLATQIEQLRGPKKAEAQRRLGTMFYDDGDAAGAFSNFEAVLAIDPADDEVRTRYVELARRLGKASEASKMLSRAAAAVKSTPIRARINLDAARFLAELGDGKRARVVLHGVLEQAEGDVALDAARALRGLAPEPRALAPILEAIAKGSEDPDERLGVLRELAALYESSLDDLASAIQARKRVLELDPAAEPEELERLLEARKDWGSLADVLEIRARRMQVGDERRALLLRAAELRAEQVGDHPAATSALLGIRAESGPARDVHALLIPLLEEAADHETLIDVLTSEIDLAEEEERSALITRLSESLLSTSRIDDALDALAEVIAVRMDQPRARELLLSLMRGAHPALQGDAGPAGARLRAALVLAPVFRREDDGAGLVETLELIADVDADPHARLEALAEAHARVEALGKDRVRALFLAGRGIRESVTHDVSQLPEWLERISQSEGGPSKAAVAETLASALRDRKIDHPNVARLAQRTGDAYAASGDLTRAIDAFRRVLELEPDNEEIIERIDHLLAEKGSPEERIAHYRSSLSRPGSAERKRRIHLAIGAVQAEDLDRIDDAIANYREGLEAIPGDAALKDALFDALGRAKRYGELYDELLAERATSQDALEGAEIDLRLADVSVLQNDPTSAVRHYREALGVAALRVGSEDLDAIEDLARSRVEVPLLVAVAERRVHASEGASRVAMLEQLGALVGDRAGDPARAAQCFLEAGEVALTVGDDPRAASAFERVLAYQPETRQALERLLEIHGGSGNKAGLLDAAERLIRLVDDAAEALDLLDKLAEHVAEAAPETADMDRLDAVVTTIEARFGRSMTTVRARTKILVTAGRIVEAAEALAALLSAEELRSEASALLGRLLDAHPQDARLVPLRRAHLEHAIEVTEPSDARARRLDLLRFELEIANDPTRGAAVLDALLESDPDDDDALVARQTIAMESRDYATAARCLERRLEASSDEDARAARAAELAHLKLETLDDVSGALDAVEPLAQTRPDEPVLLDVALAALDHEAHAARAAALLVRVAEAVPEASGRATIYAKLFDRAEAAPKPILDDPASLYRAWLAALEGDPTAALDVAARAASRAPEDDGFWDTAEALARSLKAPERVATAYREVVSAAKGLPEDVTMRVGERGVAFHEEWFDDAQLVTGMLRQIVEAAPSATWAFERLKLVYNAAERWQELFELYDRVIAAQPDEDSRTLILEDAVEVARDLAADQERAIQYLEQLSQLRPRDTRIEAQLERLYERQGKNRSLIDLLSGRLDRLDATEVRSTRLRIASLWETGENDLVGALETLRPLVTEGDEEAVTHLEGWLLKTSPTLDAPAGSYRALAVVVHSSDPVRAPAARLLEPYYATRRRDSESASMMEVLLESEPDLKERLRLIRALSEKRSAMGNAAAALEATLAEVAVLLEETEESAALETTLVVAGGDTALLGRAVDALTEIGETVDDPARSLRLLRRASRIARDDLADETRSITIDLAILSRSDEDPAGARAAARKLDKDLQAAGREADRCAVLERLALLEDTVESRREALLEGARIAEQVVGDRARAVKHLDKWLEHTPDDLQVLSKLVDNLRALGDSRGLVRALDARSKATTIPEEVETDRIEIARLFARVLEDNDAAIDAYRRVIDEHGSSDELIDELADALEAEGRDSELAQLARQEAARGGDKTRRATLFARLGEVERRRQEPAASIEAFASALELVPSSPSAQAGLQALVGSLVGSLSATDSATSALFARGVDALGSSFEQAGQLDLWLELVPSLLLALKTDGERCELLLRAARLEEEVAHNDVRALERTVQAFSLRPELPGVAQALLDRGRKTGRWDLVSPVLLPALAAREDISASVARDLLVESAAWAIDDATGAEPSAVAEAQLAAAHARVPSDATVLERLVGLRRETRGAPLVAALLSLCELREGDLDLLREALTVVLRELGDEARAVPIAERVVERASARLVAGTEDAAAEDALVWALEILEPIWTALGENDRLRQLYVAASNLAIQPDLARSYLVLAAKLSDVEEAIPLYERLYAAAPDDTAVAEELAELYSRLSKDADLARLYGRMAECAEAPDERARLRVLQAELLVGMGSPDPAISVLRQALGEVGAHGPSVELLSSLLEQKSSYSELCALFESQADLAKRADPDRALRFYRRAADLADERLKDVQRAARSLRRVAELDASPAILDRLAALLDRARQYDEEAQVLERLMDQHGRQDDLSLRLAAAYGNAGKVERAREELERAIASGGASTRVREVLASIYRSAGAWASLAELYETEADEASDEAVKVARLREAAQVYIVRLDRPGDAVRLLERAATLRPDDLEASLILSAALRVAGRTDEARANLGRILEGFGTRKPKERALVHFELARVAIDAQERALALTELESAAKIDPAHAGVLQLLGEIALEEGQFLRAQRTYRGLLLVLRSQREGRSTHSSDALFAPRPVHKSEVFVELAFIAERQKDAERKAEFVESAFEAALESAAESEALVAALEKRGYFDLVVRALAARLDASDLATDERSELELRSAEIHGRKLEQPDEAVALALSTFHRSLEADASVPSPNEPRIAALLKDLGRLDRMYEALRDRSLSASPDDRPSLLLRAATIAETYLHDDARTADALEALLVAWSETRAASSQERAGILARLDATLTRVAAAAEGAHRHARVLEQIVDLVSDEGGAFAATSDVFYRLLEIEVASGHSDAAYALLERAIREDADGDRVDERLRDTMSRVGSDDRFARLLEDFGRERGRGRAIVDALETLADRSSDPRDQLKEAYEASLDLEDPSLTERLLRRLVPPSADADSPDSVWALVELADRRFAASDAREAASLWERAAHQSDPDDERAYLLRVADLSHRVLGDPQRAVQIYEELRQREPADRNFWSPLADIHAARGDTEALARLMDETIPLVDDLGERAKLRLSLAKMLEATDPERAAAVLSDAIDEDPTNREASTLLERLYEATNVDDKLAILLDRQLDVAKDEDDKPRVIALYLRLGVLRERLGDPDSAIDAYHGALDWDADNLSALRAAVRLHTQREDSLVMGDLLDRLLELEQGDEASAIALKVADVKLASGDTVGAERALVVGFKVNPDSVELKHRLVELYTERGDRVGLARVTAAEARSIPDPAKRRVAILEAAETIKNEGDPREASDLYAEALEADPSDRDTLFFFMETCASSGQHHRAISSVDRALETETKDPWLLFSRAVLREAVGESDAALDDLEAAFDQSGGQYANELRAHLEAALVRISRDSEASKRSEADLRIRLAEVTAYGGDTESARFVVDDLLQRDPNNVAALSALGKIEELSGRLDAAALTYARAVGVASGAEASVVALRLFEASRQIGRIGLSRAGLEKVCRANPEDETLRAALRVVYEETGALLELSDLVVEEAQSEATEDVRFAKLLEAARLLLYGSGEVSTGPAMAERALAVLEEARVVRPHDQDALQLLSEALASLDRGEEARAVLSQLVASHRGKRSRELGQVFYSLYRVESKGGNLSEALEALSKAHDNQPQNGGIALELGQLAVDLDEQEIAQRAFRSVTLLKSDGTGISPQERAVAYYHLGSIAYRQGDIRRAKLMLEKSLAEDANIQGARELLGQLP